MKPQPFGRLVETSLLLFFWISLTFLPVFADDIAGIGVACSKDGSDITVRRVIDNTPAAKCGTIHEGDRILSIADENKSPISTKDLDLAQVAKLIRGKSGTAVCLTVVHPGHSSGQAFSIRLIRGDLQLLSDWGDGIPLPLGTRAPNIKLIDLDTQQPELLSDYVGKIVVLEFWSTWCQACRHNLAELQNYATKYPQWKDTVQILAASADQSSTGVDSFVKKRGWSKTKNVWVGKEAIKAFHVSKLPTTYVVDELGNVASADTDEDIPMILTRLMSGSGPR